jgi:glycoprotein endo-alpha-1,2-mannosidase
LRPFRLSALAAAVSAIAAIATGFVAGSVGVATAAQPAPSVAIFFYPWWGTPAHDGGYQHWAQDGNEPPAAIASNFYPARGVYSSSDATVLRSQMADIAGAKIDTVIVSWWGVGSVEDARLPGVLAAARGAGLSVAIHIEPYLGRTPATVAADVARLRQLGITDFYVYDSMSTDDAAWAAMNHSLAGVRLFADTALPGKAVAGGFAGFYTYDIYTYTGASFVRICTSAHRLGLICAPSVGPGYDGRRATGQPYVRSRQNGATYDWMWRQAVAARAPVVTITSYNEWHEGTQIEPARDGRPGYESYDGAWGLRKKAAQRAYLDRTALWVTRYRARLGSQ